MEIAALMFMQNTVSQITWGKRIFSNSTLDAMTCLEVEGPLLNQHAD